MSIGNFNSLPETVYLIPGGYHQAAYSRYSFCRGGKITENTKIK